jgi:hypothetical protein
MTQKLPRVIRSVLLGTISLGFFALSSSSIRAASEPVPQTSIVPLQFQTVPYTVENLPFSATETRNPFSKEPALGQGEIRRGRWVVGNRSPAIPFLWDLGARRLYLDHNRNGDLTDDGFYADSSPAPRDARRVAPITYGMFTNVLQGTAGSNDTSCAVDLNLYCYSGHLSGSVILRSFWSGKLVVDGREWQVGVVANPGQPLNTTDCFLLARPWARRDQPFSVGSGTGDALPFRRELFLQTRRFDAAIQEANARDWQLAFIENPAELGEVEISGAHIRRLVLNGSNLVVLDTPASHVRIPAGRYHVENIELAVSNLAACWRPPYRYNDKSQGPYISVGQQTAKLAVGGPLTNSVSARPHGHDMVFDYKLLGVGGLEYQFAQMDRKSPPRFTVTRAGKQLAKGTFEFG